jgi:Domain of unknown function (DUF1707)
MGSSDDLRVGDAEREAVAGELREHYAQGRLSLEDFNQRIDAAYAARTRADLDKLTRDLPHVRPSGAPLPAPPGNWRQRYRSPRLGPSEPGFGRGERRQARLRGLSTLLAAIVSLLVVVDFMARLGLPWPGRVGVLLAIFAMLRGLLRRIFGGARRR